MAAAPTHLSVTVPVAFICILCSLMPIEMPYVMFSYLHLVIKCPLMVDGIGIQLLAVSLHCSL